MSSLVGTGRDRAYRAVVRFALGLFRCLGFRFDLRGAEHIPERGGAVLAANHVSYLDFMFVGLPAHLRGRRLVRFLAKKSVFDSPLTGRLMRAMGHIPVDRSAGAGAYREAVRALASSELVGVFPESTISRSLLPRTLKSGAARMALAADVPLIPVVVWGGQRLWTAGRLPRLRRRLPIHVWVDPPIRRSPGDAPDTLTQALAVRLDAMVEEVISRYPKPTKPGAWWLPARAGGSAPAPLHAAAAELAAIAGHRRRR